MMIFVVFQISLPSVCGMWSRPHSSWPYSTGSEEQTRGDKGENQLQHDLTTMDQQKPQGTHICARVAASNVQNIIKLMFNL